MSDEADERELRAIGAVDVLTEAASVKTFVSHAYDGIPRDPHELGIKGYLQRSARVVRAIAVEVLAVSSWLDRGAPGFGPELADEASAAALLEAAEDARCAQ